MSLGLIYCFDGGLIDENRHVVADMFLWKNNGFIWLYRN